MLKWRYILFEQTKIYYRYVLDSNFFLSEIGLDETITLTV